jgi:hypothetical protein
MKYAATIADPDRRQAYLHAIMPSCQIWDDYYMYIEPDAYRRATINLPLKSAPTGRPLRDDEWVPVEWTVHHPEDTALSGKANRRQTQILRLVRVAETQNAAPTIAALAAALKVTPRTIKRDLAALRAAGHHLITRGTRG